MRPETADQSRELTVAEAACLFCQPEWQLQRWFGAWLEQGVAGIRKVPARGRNGFRYLVTRDLHERWLACTLPTPRQTA